MESVSGKTKIVGLLGWPVSHSLSPTMHNPAFQDAGLDYVYVCFPVRPDEVENAVKGIRGLGIAGANVTIPHKAAVIPCLDEVSQEAKIVGAVNTIVNREGRLSGYNTDVYGFKRSLEDSGVRLQGARLIVIGAGGVARAIAVGAALEGARSIILTDIVPEKALELADAVKKASPELEIQTVAPESAQFHEALKEATLVANASPLGMKQGDASPLKPEQLEILREKAAIFDAVYNIKGTLLQDLAGERDILYISGLDMLLYQGVRAFELWTGQSPNTELMKKMLRLRLS